MVTDMGMVLELRGSLEALAWWQIPRVCWPWVAAGWPVQQMRMGVSSDVSLV